jgi:hypothetical protein
MDEVVISRSDDVAIFNVHSHISEQGLTLAVRSFLMRMDSAQPSLDQKENPIRDVLALPAPPVGRVGLPLPTWRSKFPLEAQLDMVKWIYSHLANPFLAKEDEDYFIAKYGMTRAQVKTAFNNRRQRLVGRLQLMREKQNWEFLATQAAAAGFQPLIPVPIACASPVFPPQ